jgi:hypothetical protein
MLALASSVILKKIFGNGEQLGYCTASGQFIYQGKRIGQLDPSFFVIRIENGSSVFGSDYMKYKSWVDFCVGVRLVKMRPKINA